MLISEKILENVPFEMQSTVAQAIDAAIKGDLPIVDLVIVAQLFVQAGESGAAIKLYQIWLTNTQSPVAYAAHYNLAVLLENCADYSRAESAYRAALAQNPTFPEARNALKLRLEHTARGGMTGKPLVSILIPTHNRPEYFELALKSALAQTYENIEIIVSDNSDDALTQGIIASYLAVHPNICYSRVPGYAAIDNFHNCYDIALGDYINYLMDDDLFHPEKIERMMNVMMLRPDIGFVTSFRQLIDGEGRKIAPIPGTERLFEKSVLVNGAAMGARIIRGGENLIGEPTTVLFDRRNTKDGFGFFLGRKYGVLSDVATWLSILSHTDCAYLPEALSFFRIHGGQDQQRGNVIRINAGIEWLQMLCDIYREKLFQVDQENGQALLGQKMVSSLEYMISVRDEIMDGACDVAKVHAVIKLAVETLFSE